LSSGEDYVKKEILKTGFPLELEIFSFLQSGSWVVSAQDYYYDEDEDKSRNIDLSAMRLPNFDADDNILNPTEPINLNWNLSVECKKSKRNWVFFPVEDYYIGTSGQSLNIKYLTGRDFGHYNLDAFHIASIYTVLPKGNDEIFEAVMQLVKHINYSKNKIWDRIQYLKSNKYSINFWFPIIVFDGKMWNAFTKNGQITNVVESKHTILEVQYGFANGYKEESYAIDIVHKSYFPKLMDLILQDMKAYEQFVSENKSSIMESLD